MLIIDKIFLDHSPIESGNVTQNSTPVIGWTLLSTDQSDSQKTYEAKFLLENGDVICRLPAVAQTAQCFTYRGAHLPCGLPITVVLTVISTHGEKAEKSFIIYNGELNFDAPWITHPSDACRRALLFCKKFKLKHEVKHAALYLCGLGYHEVRINGERVNFDLLDPIHSDYGKVCYYKVIPEMKNFLAMESEISVTVAPGWRHIDSGHVTKYTGGRKISFEGKTQLAAIIHIIYENGAEETIKTDTSWQVSLSPIVSSNIFDGETYDAREKQNISFVNAVSCDPPCNCFKPMTVQPIRYQKAYRAISVFKNGEDSYIIDFGKNIAGVCRLPLYSGMKRGQTVVMKYAEVLDDDNCCLFTEPLRGAKATDTYIADGNENISDCWIPQFTYHGFRYVQLQGYSAPVKKDDFCAYSLYSDVGEASNFECGTPLVNRIHENVLQSERANIHGILTDCPQRDERMGWMNDATVRFEEVPYNFDMGRLFPKIVKDIYYSQAENGAITCTVPYVFGSAPADPVCSSYLVAAYRAYLHYGNIQIIEDCFDGFERWQHCLLDNSTDYIVNYSYYGDWASPVYACRGEEDAFSAITPGTLMSTGYSYYNCKLLAYFAGLIGKNDKVSYYQSLMDKIQAAFIEKWVDTSCGRVATGSQGSQAFALWLDILPENIRKQAAEILKEDVVNNGYKLTTGNLTTKYMFDMLAKYGYIDEAWQLLNQTEYPSLGYEINNEATTVWERWELKKNPNMNSHNHPMFGALDCFLHEYIAGIKPLEGGFSRIEIKPCMPTKLLSCRDTLKTPYGDVEVKWAKRYGKKYLYVTIPFGITAQIDFCGEKKTVTHGSYMFSKDDNNEN